MKYKCELVEVSKFSGDTDFSHHTSDGSGGVTAHMSDSRRQSLHNSVLLTFCLVNIASKIPPKFSFE